MFIHVKFNIILPLFFLSSIMYSQQVSRIGMSEVSLNDYVDSIATKAMSDYEIPGLAIGIIQSDSILLAKGFGVKNIDDPGPVDANTTFHTASISKLFTAQAVVQLFERKDLPLNSRLSELLPQLDFTDDMTRRITVKHLLNHTSGLPDIRNYQWQNGYTSDDRLEEWARELELEADSGPGIEYHYSNLGYNLLAYLIQDLSEISFEDYMQEYILAPANMKNSDFRYFKVDKGNSASPHSRKRLGSKINVRKTYPYSREHAGSSTLNASVQDLCRWMIHFLNEVKRGRYRNMLQPSVGSQPYIGLGFQLGQIEGFSKAGHYGGDRGFRSYLFLIPDAEYGLVLLANCDYNEDFRQEILHSIAGFLINN